MVRVHLNDAGLNFNDFGEKALLNGTATEQFLPICFFLKSL